MNNYFLIQLSENDKRIIIALCIAIIFLLALLGFLIQLYRKWLKIQARQIDNMMYDIVRLKVVTDQKQFKKVAYHKSMNYFFKKSWIPVLLMSIAVLITIIFCMAVDSFDLSFLFSKDEGFPTLLFIFDWKNAPRTNFFGINIISNWAPIMITENGRRCVPHFYYNNIYSWISYIVVPLFFIGFGWFLICSQGMLARSYRIHKTSIDTFQKNLDNLNPNNGLRTDKEEERIAKAQDTIDPNKKV